MLRGIKRIPLLNTVPISFRDAEGKLSATFYVPPTLCNLYCYGCHNRHNFNRESVSFLSTEGLLKKLKQLDRLGVEVVILSGGEPTLYKYLGSLLSIIRNNFRGEIRLDTNGTRPKAVKKLFELGLINSVAVDIKIPIRGYGGRYCRILFSSKAEKFCLDAKTTLDWYRNNLKRTVEIAENFTDKNLYRTVLYPLLTEGDLEEIKTFADEMGISHRHRFNPFVEPAKLL